MRLRRGRGQSKGQLDGDHTSRFFHFGGLSAAASSRLHPNHTNITRAQTPMIDLPDPHLSSGQMSSLKGWGVVKGVLSCFDLDVDSAEPTPVSRWSARSVARMNDLDDGAERFSAGWLESMSVGGLCGCGATSP